MYYIVMCDCVCFCGRIINSRLQRDVLERNEQEKKSARRVVDCNSTFSPTQNKNNEIITKYIIKEFKKRLTRQKVITRQKCSLKLTNKKGKWNNS